VHTSTEQINTTRVFDERGHQSYVQMISIMEEKENSKKVSG